MWSIFFMFNSMHYGLSVGTLVLGAGGCLARGATGGFASCGVGVGFLTVVVVVVVVVATTGSQTTCVVVKHPLDETTFVC